MGLMRYSTGAALAALLLAGSAYGQTAQAQAQAPARPAAQPSAQGPAAAGAPSALRVPISRVRSVTETIIMFITPMPPTSSESAAMAEIPSDTVPSIEDIGRANTQLRAAGFDRHWGPGRHVLGSNYFNYCRDPFGQWWEASCHIDYIEKDGAWTIANFADEDALFLWGPDVPGDFLTNPEA